MSDLERLLHPLSLSRFLDHHWGQRSYVTHASPGRCPRLFGAPELQSLPALLDCPRRDGQLWYEDAEGRPRQRPVTGAEALDQQHRADVTVVLNHLRHPVIDRLMSRVAVQLGSPIPVRGCNVYVSKRGRRTRMHFDQQEVFLVQLVGRKRWRIAPNRQVKSPSQPYFGGPLPAELALCTEKFPGRMPARCQRVTLKPGSILFLPRGFWHEGETLDDSIALTLTFPTFSWLDVVLGRLRPRLVAQEKWRALAAGLLGPRPRRDQAAQRLAGLVEDLRFELGALDLDDFLAPRPRPPKRVRRSPRDGARTQQEGRSQPVVRSRTEGEHDVR
jgi:50S ribosomal protein L16 3-hydroxylase